MYLGHSGNKDLVAGVGVGKAYSDLTGIFIIMGMNMAIGTLVSQAAGAGNLEMCGVYLNR